ncbi:MAG: CpaF family protein [Lachnospiraceae bacterium]|nr:CpaF family protein [Lachnospiraceae bacterium]
MRKSEEEIRERVVGELAMENSISDTQLLSAINQEMLSETGEHYIRLRERRAVQKNIFNSIRRLDILQDLLDDEEVTEIMVNGAGKVFIEKNGRLLDTERKFSSEEKLEEIIQQIASQGNRIVNESSPILDVRLEDGSRVNVVVPPISITGPAVTIRRFPKKALTMKRLIEMEAITKEAAGFLENLVRAGYNIFISGGTGAGKTTFLNILSGFIPSDERVITIEDSAELQIQHVRNLVRLEARNENIEGENAVTIRDLIRCALRMRPDRIVIGEVRDAVAIDMLQAMNTGHDGSLSTGHANSTADMINRLETLVLMGMDIPVSAVRGQIASALDIIVHLGRLRDGSRRVLAIDEVETVKEGKVELLPLFRFCETGEKNGRVVGELKKTGGEFNNTEKCRRAGITL